MRPAKHRQGTRKLPSRKACLNLLPNELLVQILSWVPAWELVTHCRLVCHRWRDIINMPSLWKSQWERDPSKQHVLEATRCCPPTEWGRVGILEPFGRNLIDLPTGNGETAGHEKNPILFGHAFNC